MRLGLPPAVWTIGHSSRSIDEFLDLLSPLSIELIADVRRYPGSRAYPHFNPKPLAEALAGAGIGYEAYLDLGGRRSARADSPHTIWRHPAFRGYADYMDTPEFAGALERLIRAAGEAPTAIMCSEAVWWRCHRSMIADALKVRGTSVVHIMGAGKTVEHPYTAPARIVNGRLHYGDGAG